MIAYPGLASRPDRRRPRAADKRRASLPATLASVVLLASAGFAIAAEPGQLREDFWGADGRVTAIQLAGNTLYIGGLFSRVGPPTTSAAPFDARTGEPRVPFPRIRGSIKAVLPDGNGGWFVGGRFDAVGGVRRSNLAHIRADLSVSDWDAGLAGSVGTMALDRGTLYVATWSDDSCADCEGLIALDAATGARLAWQPHADGAVSCLTVSNGLVFLAGWFTRLNGVFRAGLGAVDAVSGATSAWNPSYIRNEPFEIRGIAVAGGAVYVGGVFDGELGKARRRNLAAFDIATGLATPWNPAPDEGVWSLVASGGTVYVGGEFSSLAGQPRANLAAIDAASGRLLDWAPGADGRVAELRLDGKTLYAVGGFAHIGGEPRAFVAALDAATGAATSWQPRRLDDGIVHIAPSGEMVYLTGHGVARVESVVRNGVAALDAHSGVPLPWNPDVSGSVNAIVVDHGNVYLGGEFTAVAGMPRRSLAAVDEQTGELIPWDPRPNGSVMAMTMIKSTLYVGGNFTTISGRPRRGLAAYRGHRPELMRWNPDVDPPWVRCMAGSDRALYVGGLFRSVGGQPRSHVAAVDPETGEPTAWKADADQYVVALDVSGRTVYAGGLFAHIGGVERNSLAALDAVTGNVTSWVTPVNDVVTGLHAVGNVVYAVGNFAPFPPTGSDGIAAIDAATGAFLPWRHGPGPVTFGYRASIRASGDLVYFGGDLYDIVGVIGFAAITPPAAPTPATAEETPRSSRGHPQLVVTQRRDRGSDLAFRLAQSAHVRLTVHDVAGRQVARLVDSVLEPGAHEVHWSPHAGEPGAQPGIYFAELVIAGERTGRRIVRLE